MIDRELLLSILDRLKSLEDYVETIKARFYEEELEKQDWD